MPLRVERETTEQAVERLASSKKLKPLAISQSIQSFRFDQSSLHIVDKRVRLKVEVKGLKFGIPLGSIKEKVFLEDVSLTY